MKPMRPAVGALVLVVKRVAGQVGFDHQVEKRVQGVGPDPGSDDRSEFTCRHSTRARGVGRMDPGRRARAQDQLPTTSWGTGRTRRRTQRGAAGPGVPDPSSRLRGHGAGRRVKQLGPDAQAARRTAGGSPARPPLRLHGTPGPDTRWKQPDRVRRGAATALPPGDYGGTMRNQRSDGAQGHPPRRPGSAAPHRPGAPLRRATWGCPVPPDRVAWCP